MSIESLSSFGPQPRYSPTIEYEVFAYRTTTGEVAKRIPFTTIPTWERGLNLMGSWSVSIALDKSEFSKEAFNGIIDPWDWSFCICQGMAIRQAGPVLAERYSGGQSVVSGVGIWQLLADQRLSLLPTRASTSALEAVDADVPFGTGALSGLGTPIPALNQNLNLRGIAKRLVTLALAETGGSLPIDLPVDGVFTGTEARDYPGYKVETPGQRLIQLTQASGGPEIQFVPYFTNSDRRFVRFRMMIGSPRLGSLTANHVWRSGQGLQDVDFVLDGTSRVRRYWEQGSGSDRNLKYGFAQDLSGVTTGVVPLLERVGATKTQVESTTELSSYAAQVIATQLRGNLTLYPTVRIDGTDGSGEDGGSPHIDNVTEGDTGTLQIREHPRLPDGDYPVRIMRIEGSGPDSVTLDVAKP